MTSHFLSNPFTLEEVVSLNTLRREKLPEARVIATPDLHNSMTCVPYEGFEPSHPKVLDPKSSASAVPPAGHVLQKNIQNPQSGSRSTA